MKKFQSAKVTETPDQVLAARERKRKRRRRQRQRRRRVRKWLNSIPSTQEPTGLVNSDLEDICELFSELQLSHVCTNKNK
jgi:hypothetical protein